jgi:AAHS family 4-hydroxybenzoate transporter-like MFS transporter
MPASSSVNITELIDRYPLGRLQIRIIVLCGLVALLDGFDLLAIGVAAPAMAGPLHIAPKQFGLLFSARCVLPAALVGSAITLGAVGHASQSVALVILAIGLLVNRGWQVGDSFVALGTPALCAVLLTSLIGSNRPRRAGEG